MRSDLHSCLSCIALERNFTIIILSIYSLKIPNNRRLNTAENILEKIENKSNRLAAVHLLK